MLRKALALLESRHTALVDDVLDGKRVFWLGSGISRSQVPDVVDLLEQALLSLRDLSFSGTEQAEHRKALEEILDRFLPRDRPRFDAEGPSWKPPNLEPLRASYSQVLAVKVAGQSSDYLLMTVANLAGTYGSPALRPGLSHSLLAILIAEGALKAVVSANWDGLVEAAVAELTGRPDLLDVYVHISDARSANGSAQIAKFHGCAVLAGTCPAQYADKIIATSAQIARFAAHPSFEHMRALLKEKTTNLRSLVLGLSVQDSDVLEVFTAAASAQAWPWDDTHPAYIFAEPRLQPTQEDVLENCYPHDFNSKRTAITTLSAFGTYAEPLLAGLVFEVIKGKMMALLARQSDFGPDIETEFAIGVTRISTMIAHSLGNDGTRVLSFLTGIYTAFLLDFFGKKHFPRDAQYVSIACGTRSQLAHDPAVTMMGSDRFALALGLLGLGEAKHGWHVRIIPVAGKRMVQLANSGVGTSGLVIVRGAIEADAVLASPTWSSYSSTMTILHMHDRPASASRSAVGRLGSGRRLKAGGARRNEVWWSDITTYAVSADEIASRFRTAVGI